MDRVEAYVFNFSGENSDQSPTYSSSSPSSSATSSIGRDSDDGGKSSEDGGDDAGENEVESPYKGPLEMMESLEQVLPVRWELSKFWYLQRKVQIQNF